MFLCLHFKIVKVADVKKTAVFLIEIMPLMFIPAAVGIIESWDIIKPNVIAYAIIVKYLSQFAIILLSPNNGSLFFTNYDFLSICQLCILAIFHIFKIIKILFLVYFVYFVHIFIIHMSNSYSCDYAFFVYTL